MKPLAEVDTFACGLALERGARVVILGKYRQEGTYLYPSLGVSSLTNAVVSCKGRPPMQIPASLVEVQS